MKDAKKIRRIGLVAMGLAALAFGASFALSAFVLSSSDEYGRVQAPGEGVVTLPKGDLEASFATNVGSGEAGVVPPLELELVPAEPGLEAPVISGDRGVQITVNGDFHQRLWKLEVPEAGDFEVNVAGSTSAYQQAEVTFGYSKSFSYLYPLFGALFVGGLVSAVAATIALRRRRPVEAPSASLGEIRLSDLPPGARLDSAQIAQLEQLGRQRQAGALTEAEYEAEKTKVLRPDG